MDKYEIRRRNLAAILQSHCGGRAATLADLIERSPSYISRMLAPEGKVGKKRIGEDMRDLIENALALPRGTLDQAVGEQQELEPEAETASAPLQVMDQPTQFARADQSETTLERLDRAEKTILDLFRQATEEGKTVILRVATTVPKVDD